MLKNWVFGDSLLKWVVTWFTAFWFYQVAVVAVMIVFSTLSVFFHSKIHMKNLLMKLMLIIEKSIVIDYSHQISLLIFTDCRYNWLILWIVIDYRFYWLPIPGCMSNPGNDDCLFLWRDINQRSKQKCLEQGENQQLKHVMQSLGFEPGACLYWEKASSVTIALIFLSSNHSQNREDTAAFIRQNPAITVKCV